MGQIRKQAIISSIVIYLGFFVGFINTWFFIRSGDQNFSPAQYGLTRLFFDVGQLMYAVASLGVIAVIYKFFPYYRDNLTRKENDLYTWALLFPLLGFVIVVAGGIIFEPLIVRKFSERSELFVQYYHWVFPFGLGFLLFTILEGISWTFQRPVFPSFLKEAGVRFFTLLLIALYLLQLISFDLFIKLFAFQFLFVAFVLMLELKRQGNLKFTLQVSRVTKKFKFKIATLAAYVYGGAIIQILAQVADSIIIASVSEKGIHDAGVFNLSTYIANLIQVPQRSIVAVTIPVLSMAWKQKNMLEIERLYKRSSINLLLIGLFIFIGVWLNIEDAFRVLHIQDEYQAGIHVVFLLGISKLIDAGTGVNGQIIATSTQWRFEFITGVLLILLILPLNYFLVKEYGIIGSAYANLLSFTIYNMIRYIFLWKRYGLQPFSSKTILALVLGVVTWFISDYLFGSLSGWSGILLRSSLFALLFISGVYVLKLTTDAMQLVELVRKKFSRNQH